MHTLSNNLSLVGKVNITADKLTQAIKSIVPISGECSIKWCDDAEIYELNYQFRGMDKPTNVLSFPNEDYCVDTQGEVSNPSESSTRKAASHVRAVGEHGDEQNTYLGDIAISLETIEREAGEQGKDIEHHLVHMVVHGILHLLGYDHEKPQDAEEMESLEINILSKLGIDNPYK